MLRGNLHSLINHYFKSSGSQISHYSKSNVKPKKNIVTENPSFLVNKLSSKFIRLPSEEDKKKYSNESTEYLTKSLPVTARSSDFIKQVYQLLKEDKSQLAREEFSKLDGKSKSPEIYHTFGMLIDYYIGKGRPKDALSLFTENLNSFSTITYLHSFQFIKNLRNIRSVSPESLDSFIKALEPQFKNDIQLVSSIQSFLIESNRVKDAVKLGKTHLKYFSTMVLKNMFLQCLRVSDFKSLRFYMSQYIPEDEKASRLRFSPIFMHILNSPSLTISSETTGDPDVDAIFGDLFKSKHKHQSTIIANLIFVNKVHMKFNNCEYLESMLKKSDIPMQEREALFNTLTLLHLKYGQYDEALQVASDMVFKYQITPTSSAIPTYFYNFHQDLINMMNDERNTAEREEYPEEFDRELLFYWTKRKRQSSVDYSKEKEEEAEKEYQFHNPQIVLRSFETFASKYDRPIQFTEGEKLLVSTSQPIFIKNRDHHLQKLFSVDIAPEHMTSRLKELEMKYFKEGKMPRGTIAIRLANIIKSLPPQELKKHCKRLHKWPLSVQYYLIDQRIVTLLLEIDVNFAIDFIRKLNETSKDLMKVIGNDIFDYLLVGVLQRGYLNEALQFAQTMIQKKMVLSPTTVLKISKAIIAHGLSISKPTDEYHQLYLGLEKEYPRNMKLHQVVDLSNSSNVDDLKKAWRKIFELQTITETSIKTQIKLAAKLFPIPPLDNLPNWTLASRVIDLDANNYLLSPYYEALIEELYNHKHFDIINQLDRFPKILEFSTNDCLYYLFESIPKKDLDKRMELIKSALAIKNRSLHPKIVKYFQKDETVPEDFKSMLVAYDENQSKPYSKKLKSNILDLLD
ncbi:hypothetical protein DLAC_01688 [Tieghemostelium lacteum]|uniref:Uncharacterized protein n=1 Tax=Tieghemostelium lacteum TaxID=361077 RepID=A0A152A628_TIELA|nr:hypothetical protein DLAC_01688 [Tieghemostelium lacteum]|eukprot:KYR01682.1 hypothetical protein DLAC_01688 [Tieghemostelium lacteum]